MMVYLKRWLLPLLTILLVGSGAVLPYAVSSLQDSFAKTHIETRQFAPVNLTLQQSLGIEDVLQLLSREYTWFSYEGQTNLTSSEALQAAKEALQILSDEVRPFPVNTYSGPEIELGLVMQSDNSEASAIIWMCHFDNIVADNYIVMIDDSNGKMVKFVAVSSNDDVSKQYRYAYMTDGNILVEVNDNLDRWLNFCQKYYGINIVDCDEVAGLDSLEYVLLFAGNDKDITQRLSVLFLPNTIIFNN